MPVQQFGSSFACVSASAPLPLMGAINIVYSTQVQKDSRTTFLCLSGFRAEPAGEVESVRKILCTGWSCCANRMRKGPLFLLHPQGALLFLAEKKKRGVQKSVPTAWKAVRARPRSGRKSPCLQGRKTPAHGVGEKSFMSFTKETKSPRHGPGTFLHHSF